ncbi:hypothetical protein ACA081_00600 [Candidatus Hodgkinia cicadicola]
MCSGDIGFYSVLNLFIQYLIVHKYFIKISILPNISSIQYLNSILGSTLSNNTNISSFSKFSNWNKLKYSIITNIFFGSIFYILNPKAINRKRTISYALNCCILNSTNYLLLLGNFLGTRLENIILITISLFDICMITTFTNRWGIKIIT